MGARSKQAKILRGASEFDLRRLSIALDQPRDTRASVNAWSLEDIFQAREQQMLGYFWRPARMAEQMRTDDALAVAYKNRLAPQRCLPVEMVAAKGARGESIRGEAEPLFGRGGIGVRLKTLTDVHGCLVNHGVAFCTLVWTPRDDGSRTDVEMHYWPIEYVRWDPYLRMFLARVDPMTAPPGDTAPPSLDQTGLVGGFIGAGWVPITHGDGRWVVFSGHEIDPFRQDAAILSACVVWARHAFACRDWSKGSVSHGSAKVIGEMPTGMALQDENGLTAEAASFIRLLQDIGSSDSPVGIRPSGSKTEFITNNSTAWQVWVQLVENAEKAAARIYLGTDGTLGSNGGAPGVDITALFGVASTIVRGDLECLEEGINSGVIEPWCAINFGDSSLAPKRRYKVPDEDREAVSDAHAKRNAAFYAVLKTAHDAGIALAPAYIADLAKDYDVRVPDLTAAPIVAPPKPTAEVPAAPTSLRRV